MKIPLTEVMEQFNTITWDVLKCIKENPEISLQGIRSELNISQGKADKELGRLEGAVFIKTERNDSNLRLVIYKITPYGEQALKTKKLV